MTNSVTRRSFMKLSAAAGAAAALGTVAVSNLVESSKAFADEDVVEEMGTYCRSCVLACPVRVTMRNGRAVRLEGDSRSVFSRGRLCAKGLAGINMLYHPNRTKYPMKRVGERGVDNKWERITWDEGITMVAEALLEMRDKTGRNGLLATSGGGGNPSFNDPLAFRAYWGAGNVYEPGAAQCAMPRDWILTSIMFGGVDFPSIADGQCPDLYNPNYDCECFVIWGTGPAQSGPAQPGRCCVELREHGCKTVVIDPRYTADAARADIWLPIRPGTDVAMGLGWTNYILENNLINTEFVKKWTNLPFLVDSREESGLLLRASDVEGMDTSDGETYVYFDEVTGQVTKAFVLSPENEASYNPAVFGEYEVKLKDGTTITCKTAGQAEKENAAEWTLEKTAETCWVDKDDLEAAIKMYAEATYGAISLGVSTDQHPQSTQAGMVIGVLTLLRGNIEQPGAASTTRPMTPPVYTQIGIKRNLFQSMRPSQRQEWEPNDNKSNYEYQTPQAIIERLGYVEHKGFGCWQHSHIPSVYDAIMTGEPYQPHVWIERSGNKLVTLADASSWIEAMTKFDFISHSYMYPTSFTFEAADVMFPITEWLESLYTQNGGNLAGMYMPATILFEHADDRFTWGTIMKKCADLGDEQAYQCYYVDEIYYAQSDFDLFKECMCIEGKTFEETRALNPWQNCGDEDMWQATPYQKTYMGLQEDGTYIGWNPKKCDPTDITNSPRKLCIYVDKIIEVGRRGQHPNFDMPPVDEDYKPMPYYWEPSESPLDDTEYPLVMSEGRLPFIHHSTLRNIPYIRELYPAPEVWIDPDAAAQRGIESGDWVRVTSRRTENNKYAPEGVYGVAYVTPGISHGCVYMERFWNPEFLETEGADARKSWTTCNMNILTKREGPYNPECGSYTLRGFQVEVTKAERPEGIWYEPEDFQSWLPTPSDNTGGVY
ncbi:MAG: molybdopterin-dependent oxidoreductase [Eggerthellaceae bacterium]|nr:molybdopterin-dependent oxidoreductase [Eggerthellaceae bacterium]